MLVLLNLWLLLFPAPEHLPGQPPPACSAPGVSKVAGLAKGFLLSGVIRKGVSHEQVDRLLGPKFRFSVSAGAVVRYYTLYNLQVFWSNELVPGAPHPSVVNEVRWVASWE